MKTIRLFILSTVVMVVLGLMFSTAFGQNPLPCTSPAPHECIPNDINYDDDLDGFCNEDDVNRTDDDGDQNEDGTQSLSRARQCHDNVDNDLDGFTDSCDPDCQTGTWVDEDPHPPMCDWEACIDTGGGSPDCSTYTLKYYRSHDLLTTNANITRAIIVVHGRRNEKVTVDDTSINYYEPIFEAANALGLLNETLIIAPFFDRAKKCPVDACNECIQGAAYVDNPWCGGNADSDGRLCWGGSAPNDYPAGGNASNDGNLRASSFLLVDDMINTLAHLKNVGTFPNLSTIVVTGQSAGGQFTLRYAMAGTAEPDGITMRYVPCNPGELTYLNELRPTKAAQEAFPNIDYEWDCDGNGTISPDEEFDPPGAVGPLADTEIWSTYPVSYAFPSDMWINEDGNEVDCVTNNSFDNWPRGIANVSTGNDYMIDRGVIPNDVLASYTERDVILLFSIDDNLYINAQERKDCGGAPDVASVLNCEQSLQGHTRVERGAFFFKHECCSVGCSNHRFETVCIDGNPNDPHNPPDGVCDDPAGSRLGHGRGIYRATAAREAVFFDEQPKQWGKTLGGVENERAVAVEKTPEGGYIVLGETNSYGAGKKDFWIVKLDDAGTTLWQNTYGGSENESAAAISASPEGGYLVVGSTDSGSVESPASPGGKDAWLVKIDEGGAVEWEWGYGGPLNDSGVAVVTSDDCKYVIGGTTEDPGTGDRDIWLMKWDSNDGVLWHKTYNGSTYETFSSLQRTWDGGFIVAGETNFHPERNYDFRVLKVDKDGIVQWDKAYGLDVFVTPGDPRNENTEIAPSIHQTRDGGYILAGTTVPHFDKHMVWLLKLTGDGSITWEKLFSSPGDCDLSSVQQTDDNGYILSGDTGATGDGWMMKLDENGVKEWSNYYGGEGLFLRDNISFFQKASDGGYIAVGYTQSLAASNEDLWILKLDKNGHIPECPAIRDGFLVAEEDPSEEPVGISSGVVEPNYYAYGWPETVTQPPLERVFEGDGCNPNILTDLIDLPRTGQITPYHAGDDGHIQAGVPWPGPVRFFDNGDGTVTDYLTGLIWLKDADCLGPADWEGTLDYVADFNQNPESYSCTDYDTENPKNDWRAPNINEIESLVNAQVDDNAAWLNEQGFVDAKPVWHWSSTTQTTTGSKWAIDMKTGITSRSYHHSAQFQTWPVRGGQKDYWNPTYPANVWKTGQTVSYHDGDDADLQMGVFWPPTRFQDNEDGTVTDNLTGLIWLKDSYCFEDTETFQIDNWEDGLDAVADFNVNPGSFNCAEYDVANHQAGWRVPNRKELLSLLDWSRHNPALPAGHPFLDVASRPYWSSTTYPSDPQSPSAWAAYPTGVGILSAFLKGHGQPTVWPVRGEIHGNAIRDADFDGDGDVDGRDLAIIAAAFGSHSGDGNFDPRADMIVDEAIDQADLQAFSPHFGRTDCPCL